MKVVHLGDAVHPGDRVAHLGDVDVGRSGLHQHIDGLADDADAADQDQGGDAQAGDGSACLHPVSTMIAAATITPTDEIASASTWPSAASNTSRNRTKRGEDHRAACVLVNSLLVR